MDILIAKKYAKAIIDEQSLSLDDSVETLKVISEAINSDSRVKELLESPLVSSDKKYELLIQPLEDKIDAKLVNLFKLMSAKGRLNLIPTLYDILEKEVKLISKKATGVVLSSDDIDDSLINKLESKLSNYSGFEVKLNKQKSDIDGIKVEVSDLGLELNFSKDSVKKALLEHIAKAL